MRHRLFIAATLWATSTLATAEPDHWAYVAPLPDWPKEASVDYFIDLGLERAGLEAQPQADPARLIRRVYLDLIGLPPSIADVDRFMADPSDAHFERLVDRLLASPRFGEKWAIGWLDLARYADSDGYQRDGFRNVWPFRDWVIRAFNADMPFDQFTIEQLAGDLLPNPTQAQLIATGFHRGPILNLEAGTDPEEDRIKQGFDRVNTTGSVWLAISLDCARCHDHKYDPFSMEDYYSLLAFFNNTEIEGRRKPGGNNAAMEYIGPDVTVPFTEEEIRRREEAGKKRDRAKQVFVEKMVDACADFPKEKLAEFDKETVSLFHKKNRTFKEAKALKRKIFAEGETAEMLTRFETEVYEHKKHAEEGFFQIGFASRVMKEIDQPRETFVMKRGNFLAPGKKVSAATPGALHGFPDDAPKNRLGLARWLVADDNPLTARVAVNRLWAELFGRGLVTTMEEFGSQGQPPTHPELLDWLAVTFRDQDAWSMKKTIRRIVLSAAYRRSAIASAEQRASDPRNTHYSRGPSNRLGAELIRDNALTISSLLSDEMFGEPVRPIQPDNVWRVVGEVDNNYYLSDGGDLHRRGIYTIWRRSAHYPSFANFDAPNRGACTVQRQTSNTPMQALTLMNDPAYVEMAEAFALRVQVETTEKELDEQLEHAFRLAVARKPSAEELAVLRKVHAKGIEGDPWFDVATTLLNLHETITK